MKWTTDALTAKTRICRCCGERKKIKYFFDQSEKWPPVKKQFTLHKRTECKACHYKMMIGVMSEEHRFYYNFLYNMANKPNKSVTQQIKDLLNRGRKVTGSGVVALGASDERFLGKRIAEFRKNGMTIETTTFKGETAYKLKAETV